MNFSPDKKELVESYLNKSFTKKLLYIGRGLEKAEAIRTYLLTAMNNDTHRELVKALWKGDKNITDVFSGRDYGALKLLFGDEHAETMRSIWDRATLYPYSSGYFRRSYRTEKSSRLYLPKNIEKLAQFTYLVSKGFSLDRYLEDNRTEYQDISVIADIIAVELDKNKRTVLSKIREIIYNDNNTATVTREIIRGILMSRNEEAHRMVGELLQAAKLQEGLRQAIVESADEGSREGFIYILKVILETGLSRFSSIVRAFGTWIGLPLDVEKPKTISKCFEAAYNCLINGLYLKECLGSADNLLIYIGIWATAFDEVENSDSVISRLLQAKESYKKLVALYAMHETQHAEYYHRKACEALYDNDFEVLAAAVKNLYGSIHGYRIRSEAEENLMPYKKLGPVYHGGQLFYRLKELADAMPKKEMEFKGSVFPWNNMTLNVSEIIDKMMYAVATENKNEYIDTLTDYRDKMNPDSRRVFVNVFLKEPITKKQKQTLIECCGDRSESVRSSAFQLIDKLQLDKEDFSVIEGYLQYKSGDLRKNVIKLLLKQPLYELSDCVKRLIDGNNENKRLGAIDIVRAMKDDQRYRKIYPYCYSLISNMEDISQKEAISVKIVTENKELSRNFADGFGLYERTRQAIIPSIIKEAESKPGSILKMSMDEIKEILNSFSGLIHENRKLEYESEDWIGSKTHVTLGGSDYLMPFTRNNSTTLGNYPIADQIRELATKSGLNTVKLITLEFFLEVMRWSNYISYLSWFENLLDTAFSWKQFKGGGSGTKIPYFSIVKSYIGLLLEECPKPEKFKIGKLVTEYLYSIIPPDKHNADNSTSTGYFYASREKGIAATHEIGYWLHLIEKNHYDDESFKAYFHIAYNYYKASKFINHATLTLGHFGRALELGLIDDNEIYLELADRPTSPENLQTITSLHRYDRSNIGRFSRLLDIRDKVVEAVTEIEVKRGELNTEVTHLAAKINKCYGVKVFLEILFNSEKDTYVRGYNFVSGDSCKKEMLSHLLKVCYPKAIEDADSLRKCVEGRKITAKQLIEGAMYSPQWLDIVSGYVGISGLRAACWYFHAHVNEYFSEEKTSIIARYSPIEPQDFKDGAFDGGWFKEAYEAIGEKNFNLVYDSAKYIAGGGLHKRSQLFADAVLGKLDINEVKARVTDKRNKDYLLAYGLIPLKSKADTLERYEYIHQYLKESKQFGAQRQASEARSVEIALLNLARNAGYPDANRLSWNMETVKIDSIQKYLQPQRIEDVELYLMVDEQGETQLICQKDAKPLKDIPAKMKKHEFVLELRSVKKALNDLYSRGRQSFETAMERGEEFEYGELSGLCLNPVLAPIIQKLVLKSGNKLGYLKEGGLMDHKGEMGFLSPSDKVTIAHPLDLYEAGCWSDYQKDIFARKLVQPYKQVFRELYCPNEDELKELMQSRRYAGHQIQPKKTLALLKTRGWLVSHEEGLQKVYYKENIIATIYALADWFSPADIEAPTIESVRFLSRKTYETIPIDKVPKLIFSETMRDIDLVVSVAHVGGVDPEASLSTVEIRTVIIGELLLLLKLDNVVLEGKHAHITGVHGEYTVHLGSGVVHKLGTGSINILPVHSDHRGRIFLPFVDEDPRSAEIISKIILLAEDKKLKDPSILVQINQ